MLMLTTTGPIWSEDRPQGERMRLAQDTMGRKQSGQGPTEVWEGREGVSWLATLTAAPSPGAPGGSCWTPLPAASASEAPAAAARAPAPLPAVPALS